MDTACFGSSNLRWSGNCDCYLAASCKRKCGSEIRAQAVETIEIRTQAQLPRTARFAYNFKEAISSSKPGNTYGSRVLKEKTHIAWVCHGLQIDIIDILRGLACCQCSCLKCPTINRTVTSKELPPVGNGQATICANEFHRATHLHRGKHNLPAAGGQLISPGPKVI